jgi:trehalose 6-phosphate phosphatase
MQVLNPGVDLTAFYETLASARERVLMLDYDGTLAPFKIRREQAHPYPGVTEALARVMRDDGTRVVIISGRRAADVARLLPLDQRPEIWGAHGWECISADGVLRVHEPDAATAGALQPLTEGGALEWLPFDGGIELRAPGSNKQHAVESVLSATAPGGPVAYLGDDVTDEDAFRAVKGRGLGVLVRAEYRRTAADLWIKPPHELKNFIGRWRRKEAKR